MIAAWTPRLNMFKQHVLYIVRLFRCGWVTRCCFLSVCGAYGRPVPGGPGTLRFQRAPGGEQRDVMIDTRTRPPPPCQIHAVYVCQWRAVQGGKEGGKGGGAYGHPSLWGSHRVSVACLTWSGVYVHAWLGGCRGTQGSFGSAPFDQWLTTSPGK